MENKRRLIDLDTIKPMDFPSYEMDGLDVVRYLNTLPTVDAVEVVRCKDCKHKGWIQEVCHGKSVDYCHIWDSCINDSGKDFCSYGERKLND